MLAVWLIVAYFGKLQFRRIRQKTMDLVLENGEVISSEETLSVETFYEALYPKWEQMVRETAYYVLNKSEFWPVSANPQYLKKRINFSPAWVGAYLRINGIRLSAGHELDKEISSIVALNTRNSKAVKGSKIK